MPEEIEFNNSIQCGDYLMEAARKARADNRPMTLTEISDRIQAVFLWIEKQGLGKDRSAKKICDRIKNNANTCQDENQRLTLEAMAREIKATYSI